MKKKRTISGTLETDLLLLPDGTVLANQLTPSMAAVLARVELHEDPGTQSCLTCKRQPRILGPAHNQSTLAEVGAWIFSSEPEGGLGASVRVSVAASAGADTQHLTGEAR